MNPLARERLFGFRHAFDDPGVVLMSVIIAAALVGALAAILALSASGRVKTDLRRELFRRYFAWVVMAPAAYIPIMAGAAWTIALVAALSLLCFREFARATGFFRERALNVLVALGIVGLGLTALDHWYGMFVALGPLTFAGMAALAIVADRPKGYIQRVGLAALSFLFFGVCLGHLAYMANDAHYRALLMLLLVSVALNDVFAFCIGKTMGGPKLVPHTSPNKTISGSVGALVLTTMLFTALGSVVFDDQPMGAWPRLMLLGLIVSAAGQLGDLTISSIKRDVGIKDMGSVIPGHGGVLDRCNSLLLAAPAMFHFVGYIQGIGLDQARRVFTGGAGE
jgi:phosphatidate cytidylyltransferase